MNNNIIQVGSGIVSVVKMTVELTTTQRQLLEKIATQNGFECYQLQALSGSAKGDNYLGLITSVTIEEGDRKLELILKSALVGEFRNHMPIRQAYLREIFIYENVFAKFGEFQEKHNLSDPFQAYAKLYGSCEINGSESLVLENLRDSGYVMWNRKTPMNPDHLAAVIKEYAKFHAVSLAMRAKQPESFEELTKNIGRSVFDDFFTDETKNVMFAKAVMRNVYKVFEDNIATTEILKRFENSLPEIFTKMTQQPNEVVVDHGDCWCNNIMFSYENLEKPTMPTKVRIIDWQISKVGSPAMDLVYFLLVNSSREMLYGFEDFLKLYFDTLSKNLREFSCDPETVFPYKTLLRHWNEKIKIGIYMAFNVLKLMLCDSDEAPDFTKIDDRDNNIIEIIGFITKDAELYSKRIKDLVEFSIEKGFL